MAVNSFEMDSPFYLCSNNLPSFGDDHDNIMCRLDVFKTKTIPKNLRKVGMNRYISSYKFLKIGVTFIIQFMIPLNNCKHQNYLQTFQKERIPVHRMDGATHYGKQT